MIGEVYRRYCDRHPCFGNALVLDDARWREAPPAFVFIDPGEPSTDPIRCEGRSAAYAPTDLPGLFRRR